MSDRPPKPTENDIASARFHDDGASGGRSAPCMCRPCIVRRRAEWENKIMREALTLCAQLHDKGKPWSSYDEPGSAQVAQKALEEIGR